MTRSNFIRQQDITYLDHKHKRTWHLHKNSSTSICKWAFNHSDNVFYFQDVNEVNGIHIPSQKRNLVLSTTQIH
jgi:hypothetical protein